MSGSVDVWASEGVRVGELLGRCVCVCVNKNACLHDCVSECVCTYVCLSDLSLV